MKKLKRPWATIALLVICTAVQIAVTFAGFESDTEAAIFFGAYYKAFVCAGEWWRLVTCGIVHISIMHLFVNSISLINLGTLFENRFGILKFLLILFGSAAGGSAFMFAAEGNTVAVGLSGGLYGLMGGYIVMIAANGMIRRPEVLSMLIRIILINLMISFMPGVALSAHLGGFLTGMILTGMFLKEEKQLRIRMAVCLLVFSAAVGWFMHKGDYIREDQKYLLTDYRVLKKETDLGLGGYAYHMAQKLDNIYNTGTVLETMLEVGYYDSETE